MQGPGLQYRFVIAANPTSEITQAQLTGKLIKNTIQKSDEKQGYQMKEGMTHALTVTDRLIKKTGI